MCETKMTLAWRRASEELGIEVFAPYDFIGSDGLSYRCSAYIPYFGSSSGVIIISGLEDQNANIVDDQAESRGYYVPGLNPKYYLNFERQLWIDTLCDWGWYGPSDKVLPEWFQDLSNG